MKPIKHILARWHINRLSHQVELHSLNFPTALMKPKHTLVCLPSTLRELTLVKQFLPTISKLFEPGEITLMAAPGVRIDDIYPRKGYRILAPSEDQVTWSGLPKKNFLTMMSEYKFDTVLDLNFEASNFTSAILLSLPNAVRIGKGNYLGKPYYNLEIKTKYLRDERNIYRSLLETLALITNKKIENLRAATSR